MLRAECGIGVVRWVLRGSVRMRLGVGRCLLLAALGRLGLPCVPVRHSEGKDSECVKVHEEGILVSLVCFKLAGNPVQSWS